LLDLDWIRSVNRRKNLGQDRIWIELTDKYCGNFLLKSCILLTSWTLLGPGVYRFETFWTTFGLGLSFNFRTGFGS